MQRFAIFPLALLSALAFPLTAHADTVSTFSLSGSVQNQSLPLSGTMTVDTTTGTVLSANFAFAGSQSFRNTSLVTGVFANHVEITETFMAANGSGLESIDLLLPVSDLVGYTGGDVCSVLSPCSGANTVIQSSVLQGIVGSHIEQASLTPVASTPEPSSLELLGTGLAAAAAWAWRKLRSC